MQTQFAAAFICLNLRSVPDSCRASVLPNDGLLYICCSKSVDFIISEGELVLSVSGLRDYPCFIRFNGVSSGQDASLYVQLNDTR